MYTKATAPEQLSRVTAMSAMVTPACSCIVHKLCAYCFHCCDSGIKPLLTICLDRSRALACCTCLHPLCRSLLRFPKPQVVVYTLLMVPVVYGGSKLLSSPLATSRDWSAGVATIVLIPLPPLAFWAYVLIAWHRALVKAAKGDVKRSKSNILRAYGSGIDGESNQRGPSGSQRGGATLALLGDVTDNPTLIIRDKKPGEEDFEQFHHDSDSDDSSLGSPVKPSSASATAVAAAAAGRPWKARDSGAGMQRTAYVSRVYADLLMHISCAAEANWLCRASHCGWRRLQGSQRIEYCGSCNSLPPDALLLTAGASPRHPAAVNFLPADADEQQEGRYAPRLTGLPQL